MWWKCKFSLFLLQALQYLLDDISDFLSIHFAAADGEREVIEGEKGCLNLLNSFIDYISERESENFRSRRHDNQTSVTLTTIHQVWLIYISLKRQNSPILNTVIPIGSHLGSCKYSSFLYYFTVFLFLFMQSKGLEWDIVFIIKVLALDKWL